MNCLCEREEGAAEKGKSVAREVWGDGEEGSQVGREATGNTGC